MSGGTGPAVATGSGAGTSRAVLAAVGKGLLNAAITVGIVLAAWQALIMSGKISPYVAKGPLDVWRFLFVTDPDARATAGERRELLFDLAAVSLKDAAIGFVVGMAIAYFLDPVADKLEQKGLSRTLATTAIIAAFFFVARPTFFPACHSSSASSARAMHAPGSARPRPPPSSPSGPSTARPSATLRPSPALQRQRCTMLLCVCATGCSPTIAQRSSPLPPPPPPCRASRPAVLAPR